MAGDISALPFDDASFDVIVCFEAIEHVHDQARALDEFHRVLSATGLLIVSSPNRDVYPEGNPHHTHEFAPEELRSVLDDRFAKVRLERQQAWLLSMVCDDETLLDADSSHAIDIAVRKVAGVRPGSETFTLALAGKAELPLARDLAIVTDLGELDAWRSRGRSAEEHLEHSRQFTVDAKAAYGSAQANYQSAQANYLAARTAHENALLALKASQRERERGEQRLQRVNTLLAERNAALRIATDELTQLQAQTAALTTDLSAANASLATLAGSRSWRITAPLRALGRALRTLR